MLNSPKFKEKLKDTQWLVIDEIHALAENKRGVHLSLSVERLQRQTKGMCRIGLSATIAPLEEVAKYLGVHSMTVYRLLKEKKLPEKSRRSVAHQERSA